MLKTYHGDHIVIYVNADSLCCTPGTNLMLYGNVTSIKKKMQTFKKRVAKCNNGQRLPTGTSSFIQFDSKAEQRKWRLNKESYRQTTFLESFPSV